MFGSDGWEGQVSAAQKKRLSGWVRRQSTCRWRLVVVELGAGTAIPTVRHFSEAVVRRYGGRLVRLNLREPQVPTEQIGLPVGALAGVQRIHGHTAP